MKQLQLLLLLFLLCSCAGGSAVKGTSCKRGNYKPKKFKAKKIVAYEKTSYSVSSQSSSPPPKEPVATVTPPIVEEEQVAEVEIEEVPAPVEISENPEPKEEKRTPTAYVQVINPDLGIVEEIPFYLDEEESDVSESADPFASGSQTEQPKISSYEEKILTQANQLPVKTVNVELEESQPQVEFIFRDETISIEDGYSFNELIPFVINRDDLLNSEEAYAKIQDLAILLKNYPQVNVTIIANTATDEPHPSHRYGSDEETLSSMWEKDSDTSNRLSLPELMIARGKKIKELLIEEGVNPDQLSYKQGAHHMWKYQRYVTFVLNGGE